MSKHAKPVKKTAKAETVAVASTIDPAEKNQKIKELIKLAKEQGYLTYGDLNEVLPENILSSEELDQIMITLRGMDIEIIDASEVDRFKRENAAQQRIHGARDVLVHRHAVERLDLDQRAEAADAGEHLGALRAAHDRLDAFDELVAGVDVDACVAIGIAARSVHAGWPLGAGLGSRPGAL